MNRINRAKKFLFTVGSILILNKLLQPAASIGRLKKSRFIPVYKEIPSGSRNGKTNITWARGRKGVYIIKENNRIVYVGSSESDLYKTAMRHFQEWNDREQPGRITYRNRLRKNKYTIRIVEVSPKSRIRLLEAKLIERHNPRDNFNPEPIPEAQEEKADEALEEYFRWAEKIEKEGLPF